VNHCTISVLSPPNWSTVEVPLSLFFRLLHQKLFFHELASTVSSHLRDKRSLD
jgi:hypothetical protein